MNDANAWKHFSFPSWLNQAWRREEEKSFKNQRERERTQFQRNTLIAAIACFQPLSNWTLGSWKESLSTLFPQGIWKGCLKAAESFQFSQVCFLAFNFVFQLPIFVFIVISSFWLRLGIPFCGFWLLDRESCQLDCFWLSDIGLGVKFWGQGLVFYVNLESSLGLCVFWFLGFCLFI